MGWSTDLFCNIHYNRKSYNSKYEVEQDLEEANDMIKYFTNKLRNLAYITEPQKLFNCKDCEGYDLNPIDVINQEFEEALEGLEEYYYDKFTLSYLIDNWDYCHNEEGLAIDPPEGISWNTAFLDGDFVRTVKHPKGCEI